MAGVFSVTVHDTGLKAKLDKIAASAESKTVFERVGAAVLSKVQLGFRGGVDPWGTAWKPLKLRTGQPLSDTGRLRRSIIAVADDNGVTIGTNLKYARVHQFGATITAKNAPFLAIPKPGGGIFRKKSVTVPARPYLPLNNEGKVDLPLHWREAIVARLKSHFKSALKEAA